MKSLIIQYVLINLLTVKIESLSEQVSYNRTKPTSIYYPSPYNLEEFCNNEREKASFFIDSWKGAIFQLGYVFDTQGFPKSRSIHKCKVEIRTDKDFWLVAAVEYMKIRGSRDVNNKWKCSDFIQFSSPGRSLVGKIFSILDIKLFTAKDSEELCGDKQLDGDNLSHISDISTDANSFNTASNEMILNIHQDNDDRHRVNNSFRVVFTTFRHASEQVFAVECEGKLKCMGRDLYCIDKAYTCDGHVNCAFPGSGTDEKLCKENKSRSDALNMTSIIIVTLMSIIALGILICILSTIFCRIKARLDNDHGSATPVFTSVPLSQPTAPRIEQEETLPAYETVIRDSSTSDKCTSGVEEGELPPQYESLFPDGPPVSKEDMARDPDR